MSPAVVHFLISCVIIQFVGREEEERDEETKERTRWGRRMVQVRGIRLGFRGIG